MANIISRLANKAVDYVSDFQPLSGDLPRKKRKRRKRRAARGIPGTSGRGPGGTGPR